MSLPSTAPRELSRTSVESQYEGTTAQPSPALLRNGQRPPKLMVTTGAPMREFRHRNRARLMVTSAACGAAEGATHVTLAPEPVNVPAVAVQAYCSWSAAVSASCTLATTGTLSPASAKFAGSLARVPWMVIESTTGSSLAGG